MLTAKNQARDVAAMSFGKSLNALAPVLAMIAPEKRETVYRYLAREYEGFDRSIERLMESDPEPIEAPDR